MYSYFRGIVTEIYATHIIFEVNNVGYLIKVPNPYQFQINNNLLLYLHFHIREDSQELYGFPSKELRDIFESLINVKGLGPKGALAILASSTPEEIINALNNSSSKFFVQFPGIGQKLSQQIILDLKGKINLDNDSQISQNSEKLNNVVLALKSLGYNNQEIKNATKDLQIDENISLSDIVKDALRRLKKN